MTKKETAATGYKKSKNMEQIRGAEHVLST